MKKVITYGTYDFLHYGHIRLLENAKSLGDYLIVGVTSDDFDISRGKINVQQSLMERIEALKQTGLPDEIIVEEYEGQKIDDIRRFDVDVFAIGSDWEGKFDYLSEYCEVVYLPRTEGISSSEVRSKLHKIRIGFIGDYEIRILKKYYKECSYVNGLEIAGICASNRYISKVLGDESLFVTTDYLELLKRCDAVYILSHPSEHYLHVKQAIESNTHVLCEAPIGLTKDEFWELKKEANERNIVLMNSIKTAYSTAYYRLLLLIKSGRIGNVISIDATCTSIQDVPLDELDRAWNSICIWGPTALLPILQIMGTDYTDIQMVTKYLDEERMFDEFTKISLLYPHAVAEVKVGRGIKSEGELIISGTKGYVYVPAPWWKTDYFEIRYEDHAANRRYFYQLEGEGIRYEMVEFVKCINTNDKSGYISDNVTAKISEIISCFYKKKHLKVI